jgi:hypothetical protein
VDCTHKSPMFMTCIMSFSWLWVFNFGSTISKSLASSYNFQTCSWWKYQHIIHIWGMVIYGSLLTLEIIKFETHLMFITREECCPIHAKWKLQPSDHSRFSRIGSCS